jgi:hypothetical protein
MTFSARRGNANCDRSRRSVHIPSSPAAGIASQPAPWKWPWYASMIRCRMPVVPSGTSASAMTRSRQVPCASQESRRTR